MKPSTIPRGSILIVDDEFGPRESLRMIFKSFYEVYTVESGQEAIRFLSQNKVDLVTLDLHMPGLSGFDVLREIKNLQPGIEVIIVTAYGSLSNAQEAVSLGAGDFISKPYNVADIITTVSKSFARRSNNLKIKNLIHQLKSLHSLLEEGDKNSLKGVK
ncbi:MAG TPA: response regulator [Thermodesulfobacteriota bacterium]|nr:response regulator [Thermodesulfobacteriota bacterium]